MLNAKTCSRGTRRLHACFYPVMNKLPAIQTLFEVGLHWAVSAHLLHWYVHMTSGTVSGTVRASLESLTVKRVYSATCKGSSRPSTCMLCHLSRADYQLELGSCSAHCQIEEQPRETAYCALRDELCVFLTSIFYASCVSCAPSQDGGKR